VPPPQPDAGGPGGVSFFQTGDGPTVFRFNPRNADDIFSEFFEPSHLEEWEAVVVELMSSSSFGDDMFTSFGEGRPTSQGPRKAPPIENTLPCSCSFEELHN
jgi:DnaJ family protein B protein 4